MLSNSLSQSSRKAQMSCSRASLAASLLASHKTSTTMPDGSPQTTPVWVDVEPDGSHILINTVAGHLKANNINRDPRVAITVIDSQNPWRSVVIRGTVVEKRGPEQGATE